MKKNAATILLLCAVTLGLALTGCGSSGSPDSPAATNQTHSAAMVYGVASLGTTASGTVSAKDSSIPAQEKTTSISSSGSYTVDVSGLMPPYILKADLADNAGKTTVYSVSRAGGRTNINPITDVAVAAAVNGADPDDLYVSPDRDMYRRTSDNFESVINKLKTVLAPLFALYQSSGDPVSDDEESGDDNGGLRAMYRDVRIVISSGTVIVTNRQTAGVIFSGPLNDLTAGTFHPENMPAGPGGAGGGSATCSSFTYSAWGACQSSSTQTRTTVSSSPAGCTGGTPVLSQACTYVSPVCTYNYANWGACLSNGTQTRTVMQSTPAGCTGTPVLSQACTYVPPVTTCSSFTYSVWGACQSNSTQTRTVATSSPAGCTGGTPLVSQACTYVPPVTTCTSFTYSVWGVCQSNSTQTRTTVSSSPAGCTGGTPLLSQACTYVPPTPVCGSCHTIPPSTGQHSFHVSSVGLTCGTCHGTGYSSTTVNAATHNNGVKDVVSSLNFNVTARTCSPGCHGSRSW
jgi:hypothetical protein